ncbi:MAG: carboxyltransferase domain-containing protein [Acidobacteriota bacterium]
MQPVVSRAGDRALLIDLGADVSAAALHAAAAAARGWAGVAACVVGQQSLYVVFENELAVDRWPLTVDTTPRSTANGQRRTIEVSFADEYALDLAEFLAHAALTRDEFLARLPSIRLTARYLGFRAGFAYLEGWPWPMPRRERSRNLVPGGSFGIAASMAGFYPIDSPGGWNILGRTGANLANAIGVGDEIEIVPTLSPVILSPAEGEGSPSGPIIADVLFPGQLTTIVAPRDWTRIARGISPGGPFDEQMAAATGDGPWLECVLVAPRLRFRVARRVGWWGGKRVIQAGEILDLGRLPMFRGYIAIEGGVAEGPIEKVLYEASNPAKPRETPRPRDPETKTIHIIRGPHEAPPLPEDWQVTQELNRVGIRLRSQATGNRQPATLPSVGMQFGTLQWHPDGSLVAMGPDHPVTGGYLQPATVVWRDLWKLGQLAPGDRVRLVAE